MNFVNETRNLQGTSAINSGDTAWVLTSGALVMLLSPAVGFFYAGIIRQKNILSMLVQAYALYMVIAVVWALIGFSLAFGPTRGHFIGSSYFMGLQNVDWNPIDYAPTVPSAAFFFLQQGFAAVTPVLFIGGPAERFPLVASLIFSSIWIIIVYCPLAHWMWADGGWLRNLGALDFAGGTIVHMPGGWGAFVLAMVIGRRKDEPVFKPHNASYTVLGAALVWFGCLGFNGGSAGACNYAAALATNNTNMAAAASGIAWFLLDYLLDGHSSGTGVATGSVCGLIAMTPGSGYVAAWASLVIGFIGGLIANAMLRVKVRTKYVDDPLDVVACHGCTGTWGVLALGFFACADGLPVGAYGAFYGNGYFLGYEIAGILASFGWTIFWTTVLALIFKHYGWLRSTPQAEDMGLDLAELDEQAYVVTPAMDVEEALKSYKMVASTSIATKGASSTTLTPFGIHENEKGDQSPGKQNEPTSSRKLEVQDEGKPLDVKPGQQNKNAA